VQQDLLGRLVRQQVGREATEQSLAPAGRRVEEGAAPLVEPAVVTGQDVQQILRRCGRLHVSRSPVGAPILWDT